MPTDDEFIAAFEGGTLPPEDFHHRDHVRLTWLYLERYGRDGALQRLDTGLRAFATRAGKPEKYNYPLTVAWLDAIDEARRAHPEVRDTDTLTARRPDLLDRKSVRTSETAFNQG